MTRARILADYVSSGDELALKAPLASPAFTGTPTGITAAHLEAGVLPAGVTGGSVGGLKSMTSYTVAGSVTYTIPSGINTIKVFVVGGGGSGGGGGDSTAECGGGGGAGGCAIKILDVTNIDTCTAVVGAGGASVTGATHGNDGVASTFAKATGSGSFTTLSGSGGEGGGHGNSGSPWGGDGGTGSSGGDLNLRGGPGGSGKENTTINFMGGHGGNSFFGGGSPGVGKYRASVDGIHGGGGGGGHYQGAYVSAKAGGAGIIVIEEYS